VKRYHEPELSPEAAAYLADLRALSAEAFREKRTLEEALDRSGEARRRGDVLSERFQRKGTTKR